jgi:hypothetical protein
MRALQALHSPLSPDPVSTSPMSQARGDLSPSQRLEVHMDGGSGVEKAAIGGKEEPASAAANISEPASVTGSVLNPASSYWSILGANREQGAFDDLESDVFGNASVAVNSEVIDPLAYKIPCPVSSGGKPMLNFLLNDYPPFADNST